MLSVIDNFVNIKSSVVYFYVQYILQSDPESSKTCKVANPCMAGTVLSPYYYIIIEAHLMFAYHLTWERLTN